MLKIQNLYTQNNSKLRFYTIFLVDSPPCGVLSVPRKSGISKMCEKILNQKKNFAKNMSLRYMGLIFRVNKGLFELAKNLGHLPLV